MQSPAKFGIFSILNTPTKPGFSANDLTQVVVRAGEITNLCWTQVLQDLLYTVGPIVSVIISDYLFLSLPPHARLLP